MHNQFGKQLFYTYKKHCTLHVHDVLPLAERVARFIQKKSHHMLDLLGFSNAILK